jgi:Peptidase A4 family
MPSRRWLLVAVAVALGGVVAAVAVEVSGGRGRPVVRLEWSFGPFAGYNWFGSVTEVRGAWIVPRIARQDAVGAASTWIGAQAPRGKGGIPFVQIGTQERHALHGYPSTNTYWAFWTDTRRDTNPIGLFEVAAGDRIGASLELSHGRWKLSIRDFTSANSASLVTREEAGAEFNEADWLQEDDTDTKTNRPGSYPRLTPTRFLRFAVNGSSPRPDSLIPQWMSLTSHQFLGPERRGHSFTVRHVQLTRDDDRYLLAATPEADGVYAFENELDRWSAATPITRIRAQAARFVRTARAFMSGLRVVRWPPMVQSLTAKLIAALRAQTILMRPGALPRAENIDRWRRAWYDDNDAVAATATALDSRLGIPPAGNT